MLARFLPSSLIGVLTFLGMLLSVMLWGGLIVPLAVLKLLIPIHRSQRACSRAAVQLAVCWVATNRMVYALLHSARGQFTLDGTLDPRKNYLLICNHQEWTDIVILFDAFHHRTPLLRFFLKYELLYVPLIGSGCWAMDFPFMKRHTREQIAANPALRDEDLQTTRRACEIYRSEPVTVVNFVEGTRFSEHKRASKGSPYRHLLRPKSAGLSFTLNAMGEQFAGLIDCTLVYEPTQGRGLLWSWLRGDQRRLRLHAQVRPLPADLLHGDYESGAVFRERFQQWVNTLWAEKEARIEALKASPA